MKESFKNLVLGVSNLSQIELERANKKWPLFNSLHEAYGVINEELEETSDELENTERGLRRFWYGVKNDFTDTDSLLEIKANALNCAAESVQVAAMAQKAIDSFSNTVE